jgi:multidrug efflux pump subunit AcrA (membrane-fusion protein)
MRTITPLDRLKIARGQLEEAESNAQSTLTELDRQKKVIQKGQENIQKTKSEQSRAMKFINQMMNWWRG